MSDAPEPGDWESFALTVKEESPLQRQLMREALVHRPPTLLTLVDAIRDVVPGAVIGVEENFEKTLPIIRGFWSRVWAAIRDKPVLERRRVMASVRFVIIAPEGVTDLDAVRRVVDQVRPAGVAVVFDRVNPTPGALR